MAVRTAAVYADQNVAVGDERGPDDVELIKRCNERLMSLEVQRYSWWLHWRELADYILPRRYRWLITPNQWNRGSPINQRIIDSTATLALRTLASGLMAGITSPSRPWFRLTVPDQTLAQNMDVKLWCDEVVKRMQRVMAASNYYTAKAMQYVDLSCFGTAPMIIYEDYDSVIRCYNPCAGEYYAACGARFDVDTLGRKFVMTVHQVVDEFGLGNVSEDIKTAWRTRGASLDREVIIGHIIEPNPDYVADGGQIGPGGVPRTFKYREIFWEWAGGNNQKALRKRGFSDQPFSCPRWDVSGNDAYGRSPCMDALGDVKQLQLETKRKAQAIDKIVNPPMVADPSMKNQPASLLPGAVTYASSLGQNTGFRPAFQVNPPLGDMTKDIAEVQSRVKDALFVPLFMTITNLDTVRTATDIDARREEQMIQLGPMLERNEAEGLSPDIKRIFAIMARGGYLPPMPDVMRQAKSTLKIEYVSMLAQAQRATSTSAIERLWQFTGNIAAARQEALDKLDVDATIDVYADLLNVSPRILVSNAEVAKRRAARAQAAQQQKAMVDASAAVQGAQTLSDTDVGGGQNALQMMLQGSGGGAGGA